MHFLFCQNMPMPPMVKFMRNILKDHILRIIYVLKARPKSVYTRVNKTHKHVIYIYASSPHE